MPGGATLSLNLIGSQREHELCVPQQGSRGGLGRDAVDVGTENVLVMLSRLTRRSTARGNGDVLDAGDQMTVGYDGGVLRRPPA